MNEFFSHPAVLIIIGAIPTSIYAYLAHRKSTKVDKVTKEVQDATERRGGINQVIEGLETLAENLQKDNDSLRKTVETSRQECKQEIEELRQKQAELVQKQAELMDELAVLKKALAKDIADDPRY